ncbi:hypothetical protein [Chamaesiphon sp.]|uniref:hypothetical protein n=1 Tax=Chamaesiphon sp. TaxID=2814140 RepID=UPI003594535A
MSPHHQQKINLNQEYPCPCHLHGKLQEIVLTEAFGCNRCHRLFVLQEDGLAIEELAATYPYKRRYYWDGNRFRVLRSLPKSTVWAYLGSPARWQWLQCLSAIGILWIGYQLYCRITLTNPISNLVLSMAIAIVVITVITFWLFDQD